LPRHIAATAATISGGDPVGARALIEVLLAHSALTAEALAAALRTAISSGVLDPQAVLIDARRHVGAPRGAGAPAPAWRRKPRRPHYQ